MTSDEQLAILVKNIRSRVEAMKEAGFPLEVRALACANGDRMDRQRHFDFVSRDWAPWVRELGAAAFVLGEIQDPFSLLSEDYDPRHGVLPGDEHEREIIDTKYLFAEEGGGPSPRERAEQLQRWHYDSPAVQKVLADEARRLAEERARVERLRALRVERDQLEHAEEQRQRDLIGRLGQDRALRLIEEEREAQRLEAEIAERRARLGTEPGK